MLNKNDPLIGAVQEVMKRNQAERDAARVVNEYFGIEDRKALPHEHQGQWDAAYKQVLNESDDMGPVKKKESAKMYKHKTSGKEINSVKHPGKDWEVMKEALHPNQQKLDVHEPEKDKLTAQDFKMLRAKKKPMEESDVTSPSSMGIKKPDYAPAGTTPDYAKPKTQTVNRAAKTSLPAGTIKEAVVNKIMKKLAEKKMTDAEMAKREEIAKSMKPVSNWEKRYPGRGKEVMYATATKQAMKEEKEGFNIRHGLSVTASAEKQAVADQLNEKVGNPLLLNKAKARARIGDSGVRRPISGTNNLQTRLARLRNSGAPLDANRNAELDKPGLEKAGVAQALKDPKAREVLGQTTKDAAEFAIPSALTGGPLGRAVGGALRTAYNYYRGGNAQPQPGQLAAGAARRPSNQQSVPMVRQTSPSTGSNLPSGPWGSIARRGGDSRASAVSRQQSTATRDTFQGKLAQARQTAQQGNAPNAAAANAARIANRPTTPNAAGANAARLAKMQGNKTDTISQVSGEIGSPSSASAATNKAGPSFEKTGRGNAPSVSSAKTNAQTNLKPANVMSAKPSFEFSDKQREAAKKGKAGIKDVQAWAQSRGIKADPSSKEILRNYLNAAQNKTMKTDVKAGGTAATPTQTAAQSAELKMKAGMAQRSGPSVPAKPTSSATPNVQPARNSTLAAPSAMVNRPNVQPARNSTLAAPSAMVNRPNVQPARNSTLAAPSAMAAAAPKVDARKQGLGPIISPSAARERSNFAGPPTRTPNALQNLSRK